MKDRRFYCPLLNGGQVPIEYESGKRLIHGIVSDDWALLPPRSRSRPTPATGGRFASSCRMTWSACTRSRRRQGIECPNWSTPCAFDSRHAGRLPTARRSTDVNCCFEGSPWDRSCMTTATSVRPTELGIKRKAPISPDDFHILNRCLDDAIAGRGRRVRGANDISRRAVREELAGMNCGMSSMPRSPRLRFFRRRILESPETRASCFIGA
jgi:hypothetical protein